MTKTKIVLCTLACIFMAFLSGAAPCTEKAVRVGRVSMLKGMVMNTKTGNAVKLCDSIMKGDTLEVPPGAVVRLIFYQDYHEVELQGKCAAQIGEKEASLSSGDAAKKKTTRKPYTSGLSANPASRGREIAGGASRKVFMNPATYLLYPVVNTLEMPKKVTVTWKAPAEVKVPYYKVTFSALDGDNARVLHSAVVKDTSFTLPDSVKPLESGKIYMFSVEGFLKNPAELGSELPESRVAASSPPNIFTMPSQEAVKFINIQKMLLKKMARGSEEWSSYALFLFSLYLEYGADDQAALLAKELSQYGKESDLFSSNIHLKGLIECYAK